MNETYDIFRDLAETGPIWIEAVQGLESCKGASSRNCSEARPGNYFIYDPLAAKVIASTVKSAQMPAPVTFVDRLRQY